MATRRESSSPRSLLAPLAVLIVCVFVWPALFTFDAGDWPSPNQYPHNDPPRNACGMVGAYLAYYLTYVLGDGAFPLVLFGTLAAGLTLVRGEVSNRIERILGLALVVVCTSSSTHLLSAVGKSSLPVGNGGLVGFAMGELLSHNLSGLGTLIVIGSSFFVGLLFATEGWVLRFPALVRRVGDASLGAVATARQAVARAAPGQWATAGVSAAEQGMLLEDEEEDRAVKPRKRRAGRGSNAKSRRQPTLFDEVDDEDDESTVGDMQNGGAASSAPAIEDDADAADCDLDESESASTVRSSRPKRVPIVNFPSSQRSARAEPYPKQIENWRLPSLELLEEPEYGIGKQREAAVREQAKILERTLEEFRLDAHVVAIDTGPVITMFELSLGAGVKVAQISSLSNDIARALKAHAIRVVAPISGKNTVGIEVPNLQKEKVRLRELMTLAGKKASEMALPLFLGKDAGGDPLVCDLAKMPHALIAGTTGSGKSVCVNAIILSLLMTKRPDHVKFILVDPKMVEMSQFKGVPHLMCPIVTDMKRAEQILGWAVTTMDERYELLAESCVKNIDQFNRLGEEEVYRRLDPKTDDERARICTHLPFIVILIDELADLMMTSAKEVEHHLSRLAQKSRAVGVHIIVATQRPEAKVVTGLIKSNLPSRICFRVASRMDSRIVLDQNGGEVLMGQGDMLFLPPGSHKLVRAQGTYLEEAEVQAVLDDLTSRAKPEYHPALMRIKHPTAGDDLLRDPVFDEAVRIVLDSKRGSVSLLQRRLTIGYSRASRLIDQMSAAGIVGEYKGSQAREVMMTVDEWDVLRAQVEADCRKGYEADEDDESSDEAIDDSV